MEGVFSAEYAKAGCDGISSQIRKAKPIDKRLLMGVSEDTGFGVTGLWVESDCPEFCKAESQISPS